jgi:two-component system response regulator
MMTRMNQPILIVEDSPEDFETTVRGLTKAGLANPIFHCEDGDEALDFLRRQGNYTSAEDSPRPGIILLDLNLPGTDGREVLAEIKEDSNLKTIPVIVLTTSTDERDIQTCYQAGANSYIHKPVGMDGFMTALQRLTDYWFEIVVFPKDSG